MLIFVSLLFFLSLQVVNLAAAAAVRVHLADTAEPLVAVAAATVVEQAAVAVATVEQVQPVEPVVVATVEQAEPAVLAVVTEAPLKAPTQGHKELVEKH